MAKLQMVRLIPQKMRFFRKKNKVKALDGADDFQDGGKHVGFAPTGQDFGSRHHVRRSHDTPLHSPDASLDRGERATSWPKATPESAALLLKLPDHVLRRIFALVCPHSQDESYETCEDSIIEDACPDTCPPCDTRDLASCLRVNRKWRKVAVKVLYRSLRLDPVHYCEREIALSDKRKRRSRFDRNGDPEDPTRIRLRLLSRTLRDDPAGLGALVKFFKTPYMLRESHQAELARIVAVLPNLKYVDLPGGLFQDDPCCLTLRTEVQARCHNLRKMTYVGGSERSLQMLAGGPIFPRLEVLELTRISIDPAVLRQVLACLGKLRALKMAEMDNVGDEVLAWSEMLPPFPPLEEFILTDVPNITSEGFKSWLSVAEARKALKVLTLNSTGVKVWTLQDIFANAPSLRHFTVTETVTMGMTTAAGHFNMPLLSCPGLETLHYEITAGVSSPRFSNATTTYYNYLSSSLLSGGLPNLGALYVREPNFPNMLLGLPTPMPSFATGGFARPGSSMSKSTGDFSRGNSPRSANFNDMPSPRSFVSPVSSSSPGIPPSQFKQMHLNPDSTNGSNANPFLDPPKSNGLWARQSGNQFPSNNPFAAAASAANGGSVANLPARLEVFTKDDDELDWSRVTSASFTANMSPGGTRRNLSNFGLSGTGGGGAAGWSSGAGARMSVFVTNGANGGFLALPSSSPRKVESEWPGPGSDKKGGKDLWR